MHIDEANLSNLTKLWHKYGSQPVKATTLPLLQANTCWPHRCWIDWKAPPDNDIAQRQGDVNDSRWMENIPESTVFPLWPTMSADNNLPGSKLGSQIIEQLLLDKRWHFAFEQTAMYIALQGNARHLPQTRSGFKVKPVDTLEDIKVWTDIGSEAFAYQIDLAVIQQLVNLNDIQLLLGWESGQAIASGLLYKTGDIIGVHQYWCQDSGCSHSKSTLFQVLSQAVDETAVQKRRLHCPLGHSPAHFEQLCLTKG